MAKAKAKQAPEVTQTIQVSNGQNGALPMESQEYIEVVNARVHN